MSLIRSIMDGVARSVVCDLMDVSSSIGKYRFDKLENANLIEVREADSLPKSSCGSNPTYAVSTEGGRRMVENIGLLPILTRDRDLEEQFDMLVADYRKVREAFITGIGRQALLIKMINESNEPFSEFQLCVTKDLPELGERVLTFDLERGLSLGDDEYSFGKLIGEMDDKERELAIEKLLNENMKTRLLSEFVHRI